MTQFQSLEVPVIDESGVTRLAGELAELIAVPFIIYLQGPLGAGKTTFARAFIGALGYRGRVKSPTYSLLEIYETGAAHVVHLDLYRISDPGELEYLGIEDAPRNLVLLVEWPEKAAGKLPPADLVVALDGIGETRKLVLTAYSGRANRLMESVAWEAYPI